MTDLHWIALALLGTQFVGWLVTRHLQSQIYMLMRKVNDLTIVNHDRLIDHYHYANYGPNKAEKRDT